MRIRKHALLALGLLVLFPLLAFSVRYGCIARRHRIENNLPVSMYLTWEESWDVGYQRVYMSVDNKKQTRNPKRREVPAGSTANLKFTQDNRHLGSLTGTIIVYVKNYAKGDGTFSYLNIGKMRVKIEVKALVCTRNTMSYSDKSTTFTGKSGKVYQIKSVKKGRNVKINAQ